MTEEQFMKMLKNMINERMKSSEVLLETPGPKKTIREKARERAKTRKA